MRHGEDNSLLMSTTSTPSRSVSGGAAVSLISLPLFGVSASPASSVATASTAASSARGDDAPVDIKTSFGSVDLLNYLGKEATKDTHALVNDPHIEIVPRGLEPRLYFPESSKIETLRADIIDSAKRSDISLKASGKNDGGRQAIEFYCCEGVNSKNGKCTLRFVIRLDKNKNQWYFRVGSGCPHHSEHKPKICAEERKAERRRKNAECGRKRRRKEKQLKMKAHEETKSAALEKFGLTSSDFDGDSTTREIAAAAAVAASVVPSSVYPFISSGRCYLIPPVIEYRPNDIMVSCSCKAHASKHFWVGPKPDGMDELIAKLCSSCGFSGEGDGADKCSSRGGESVPSPGYANSSKAPTEHGINRQVKRVDKDISEKFYSDEAFYAIKISKPTKAKKAETTRSNRKYQFLSISGFPANTNPVASCSRLKISKNTELVMQNDIIEAGKELFASRWVEDAETRRKGSSSKYYTLLLHDHNAESGILESGLSSIYFRPMENTKYWWLSYLTTREGTLTERKGYGNMMMWRFINMARRAEGVKEIWLEVRPELKGARALYAKLGFVELDWNDLPKEIEGYVMVSPDLFNPQATVKNRVYQHPNEFILMRLELSIFP